MKRHPFRANGSEFADSAVSNVVATFRQCLSPIASKLSTRDKNQNLGNLKASWYRELAKKLTDSLVPGALRWWSGVGNDRSIAVCISGCRKAINKHWTEISRERTYRP